MILNRDIKESIDKSVLCWLATASRTGNEDCLYPNVSPKEVFNYYAKDKIIIANIASPQSVRNIRENENVCLSFIDILVQKGFQIKGKARIVTRDDTDFKEMEEILLKITEGKFPFLSITEISVLQSKVIIAPKYILYPGTTEEEQIESAKRTYGFL